MVATRVILGFAVATCLAPAAPAQLNDRTHTLSVTGDAQINVKPDKVLITLGVETLNPSLSIAKKSNDADAARVLEVTRTFNIAAKDVQTDYISIEPQLNRNGRDMATIVGYTVRKSMRITLRDVPSFDAFLSAAVENGANQVLDIEFVTSDLRKYRDQARTLAIKAAREKADALAAALGQHAGMAITINEQGNQWWSSYNSGWGNGSNRNMSQNVMQNAGGASPESGSGDSTAPGETRVSASVSVVFVLNP